MDNIENTLPPIIDLEKERIESQKKFFAKRQNLFPAKNSGPLKSRILPSHRVIFQNYKDQGFRNLGKAIRMTGVYSPEVAKRVDVITKSKSWQLLMQEYMPEEHLALRHSELLDKREIRKVERLDEDGNLVLDNDGNPIKDEIDNGPDTAAVTKGLELAYRPGGRSKRKMHHRHQR